MKEPKTGFPYQGLVEQGDKQLQRYRSRYSTRGDISAATLRALRESEEWAYDEVYKRYALPLKDFLTALIRNEEDAKEINHDIFLSLWTDRAKIVPERGIRGFLYMRAKNLAMNYFDHAKVVQKYADFIKRDIDFGDAPDQHLISNEARILIEIALRGMTEQRQTIFKMRYEEGLSIDEIALRLNLGKSTVKNNLTMITKALREVLSIFMVVFM